MLNKKSNTHTHTHTHTTQVIPKSVNKKRLKENIRVFDFVLSEAHMAEIESMNCNYRFGLGWLPGHYLPTDIGDTSNGKEEEEDVIPSDNGRLV